jgi:proteasome lid subunit RPN8/RPN11
MDQVDSQPGPHELVLTYAQWVVLCAEVERIAPEEACGLLAGQGSRIEAVIPVTNALHSQVRYRMDPAEQVKAFLEIERRGWELIGIYHSHPVGPDVPSQTDKAEAFYPESVYLILSGQTGRWQVRGFFIRNDQVDEVPVRIEN